MLSLPSVLIAEPWPPSERRTCWQSKLEREVVANRRPFPHSLKTYASHVRRSRSFPHPPKLGVPTSFRGRHRQLSNLFPDCEAENCNLKMELATSEPMVTQAPAARTQYPGRTRSFTTEAQWATQQPMIKKLYVDEGRTLQEVMDTMKRDFGFDAT